MDPFGRHIDYLRVSVTDRCNERCLYCMPRGYKGWAERADHLTADEMMTGAPLPLGADCIVPVEEISRTGKIILVSPDFEVIPRRYVHAAGSDAREGGRLLELGILLGLRDDPAESAAAVRSALEESDSVIISGAVSKGGARLRADVARIACANRSPPSMTARGPPSCLQPNTLIRNQKTTGKPAHAGSWNIPTVDTPTKRRPQKDPQNRHRFH